jgi:hypothetical protein
LVLDSVAAFISDADVDLSIPAAIDVDSAGNVWVVDRRLAQVLIVDPDGVVLHTFGRAGGGPGEFRGPRGIGIRGDRAYVLDNVHGVQAFDMQGNHVSEYPAPRIFFDFDFTGEGTLVANNNRVWARGGMVSVIGADGGLLFETAFDLPEMPAIREQYFADFAAAPSADTFFFPSFVASALPVGDSLLLLWETAAGGPGLITVHGADGALVQRWLLPELDMGGGGLTTMDMGVDVARRRLYVSVSDIATVFRFALPDDATF